jgi:hypothetical protein
LAELLSKSQRYRQIGAQSFHLIFRAAATWNLLAPVPIQFQKASGCIASFATNWRFQRL